MSRLLMWGDFKGDVKTLFGLLFLRQHYLQESDEDQETKEPDQIEDDDDDDGVDEDDYE